jgi:hypothetical protein
MVVPAVLEATMTVKFLHGYHHSRRSSGSLGQLARHADDRPLRQFDLEAVVTEAPRGGELGLSRAPEALGVRIPDGPVLDLQCCRHADQREGIARPVAHFR